MNLPLVHVVALEELWGLSIMQKSIPAFLLSLRQRAQDVSGGHVTGLTLYLSQTVFCDKIETNES